MGEKVLRDLTQPGGMTARGVALLLEWYLSTATMNVLNATDQSTTAAKESCSNRQLSNSVLEVVRREFCIDLFGYSAVPMAQ